MRSHLVRSLASVAAGCLVAACGGSSTESPVPTTIVVSPAGAVTLASINATRQLTAAVLDQHGTTMTGVTVTWGSSNAAAATVSASGLVTAAGNGTATITATSGGAHLDVACTVAQVAAGVSKIAGDAQSATVGQAVATPLDARVIDGAGFPVVGQTVTFAVTSGGGSLGTLSGTTNATGDVTTTWTLGTVAGTQTATASAGAAAVQFAALATAAAASVVTINAGNNQSFTPGTNVPIAPAVKVTDAFNNLITGASVQFTVTAGGGSVTGAAPTTNASGIATVGSWTLGAAGTNTLQAKLVGPNNTVSFTANAVAAGAAKNLIVIAGGTAQTALNGYGTNVRPAVQVTDANTVPLSGVTVTFAVTAGGGSVTTATVNTNANGVAQIGSWVVGAASGANTLQASIAAAGVTGNPATFSATGAAPTFNITLLNIGPPLSAPVQQAFDSAVAHWQRVIYQDIPDQPVNSAAGQCAPKQPAINQTVDDILILVNIDSIDGPGKILGQAGPCLVRLTSRLTVLGSMQFDSADMPGLSASGLLKSVILHEMGHVLGFGSLWSQSAFNCIQNPSSTGVVLDTYYSCPSGRLAFDSIGGTSYTGGNKVPVENCGPNSPAGCGAGTFNSHWREPTFFNELMSGYLNNAVANPLSLLSIAAMEDLGYGVNYAAAEAYTRVFNAPPAVRFVGQQFELKDDVLHLPIYVVDAAGRVVKVIAP